MAKKKSKLVNQHKPRISLDPMREQLSVLVNMANERANQLISSNLISRALLEAQRTLARQTSRSEDEELFKSNLKTRQQINREFARVHAFLNDYTSTPEGAENFKTNLQDLAGAFGAQWNDGTGKNYDTSRIDDDIAAQTFDIYRKTVEAAGGWERAVGMFQGKESLIGYGSENLIIAIYDMIQNKVDEGLIMNRALNMVQEGIAAYEEMASKQVQDYDYGIVFDDETAARRRAFYTWRRSRRGG